MSFQINNMVANSPNVLTQEYSSVPIWNPVNSVLFTTNLLPIYNSTNAPIQVYEDGKLLNNNTDYHFLNVLTDFVGNNLNFTPFIEYIPSIYRFIDLKPNTTIRNIDVQVYWQNRINGELKPLYLTPGGSCAMKLYFTRE